MPTSPEKFFLWCREGRAGLVKAELERGGDVDRLLHKANGWFRYMPLHAAAAKNQHEVVEVLVRFFWANVNSLDSDGYTPLHLAASLGYKASAQHLLTAEDVEFDKKDRKGKTAMETAQEAGHQNIARLVSSAELIQAVKRNSPHVLQLLMERKLDDFDHGTFDRCFSICAERGFLASACLLSTACAKYSIKPNYMHYHQQAMTGRQHILVTFFTLCHAVANRDVTAFQEEWTFMTNGVKSEHNMNSCLEHKDLESVEKKFKPQPCYSCLVSFTIRPSLLAQALRINDPGIAQTLLYFKDCKERQQRVDWHGLVLRRIHPSWLEAVCEWVQKLNISSNCLIAVPMEINTCQSLTQVQLRSNHLTCIPDELVQLPALGCLELQENKIQQLPECDWTESLSFLDVTENELRRLPHSMESCKQNLDTLKIAYNNYETVPRIISSFRQLTKLDISYNLPGLTTLPDFLGDLKYLATLKCEGLHITHPPRARFIGLENWRQLKAHLRQRVRGCKKYYGMKLMLVGLPAKGKTTLIAKLQGKQGVGNLSTVGIDITEWLYKPPDLTGAEDIRFSVWDFAGQPVYHAAHQCFLSDRSMYIVVWSIMDEQAGIDGMRPWLENIRTFTSHSPVMIVTTHLDVATERGLHTVQKMQKLLHELCHGKNSVFKDMGIVIVPFNANIETIRRMIHEVAVNSTYSEHNGGSERVIVGQEIPKCYMDMAQLIYDKRLEFSQAGRPQIICSKDLESMLAEKDIVGLEDEDELLLAVKFLHEIGVLLHYGGATDLDKIYFCDPQWLSNMISVVLAVKEKNPLAYGSSQRACGVMRYEDIWSILLKGQFPQQYYMEYLSLLDYFSVAVCVDDMHLLIPSILVETCPRGFSLSSLKLKDNILVRQYRMPCTPNGMWSRLIARLLCLLRHELETLELLAREWVVTTGLVEEVQRDLTTPQSVVVWNSGLLFEHELLTIAISGSGLHPADSKGIVIFTSGKLHGRRTMAILLNEIDRLLADWYPKLLTNVKLVNIEALCPGCKAREKPKYFNIRELTRTIAAKPDSYTVRCDTHKADVSLLDLIPEQLLADLPTELILQPEELQCNRDDSSKLGKGGYGEVHSGLVSGERVAVKSYLDSGESRADYKELSIEVSMLERLKHPNVVHLVGVIVNPPQLVLELAPKGSLASFLDNKTPLPRLLVFAIASQIAEALEFLEQKSVLFRDLKGQNILVFSTRIEDDVNVKLTDFGLAVHSAPYGLKGSVGTLNFQPPELLRHMAYTKKCDMYSFGCVLWELLTNTEPFSNHHLMKITKLVLKGDRPKLKGGKATRTDMPCLETLMHQAWHQSAKLRPSALDAAMFLRSRHVELLCSSVDFPKTMQTVHVVVHSEVSGAYWLMSGEGSSKATTCLHMLHDATLKLMVTLSLATPIVDVMSAISIDQSLWIVSKGSGCVTVVQCKNWHETPGKALQLDSFRACLHHSQSGQQQSSQVVCIKIWQSDIVLLTSCGCVSAVTSSQDRLWSVQLENDIPHSILPVADSLWAANQQQISVYKRSENPDLILVATWSICGSGNNILPSLTSLTDKLVCVWYVGERHVTGWTSDNHGDDQPTDKRCPHVTIDTERSLQDLTIPGCSPGVLCVECIELCIWVALQSGIILLYDVNGVVLTWIKPFSGTLSCLVRRQAQSASDKSAYVPSVFTIGRPGLTAGVTSCSCEPSQEHHSQSSTDQCDGVIPAEARTPLSGQARTPLSGQARTPLSGQSWPVGSSGGSCCGASQSTASHASHWRGTLWHAVCPSTLRLVHVRSTELKHTSWSWE